MIFDPEMPDRKTGDSASGDRATGKQTTGEQTTGNPTTGNPTTGGAQIRLRPATEADEDFILSCYASTRAQEMAQVPWPAEQKEAFVRMQYTAQKNHYAAEAPRASHDIICVDTMPVGRIYLDRREDALHILDITVLPGHRNQGTGSRLLRRLMDEAGKAGKPVTIYVESFNPSLRLFERLGFRKDHEKGFHRMMKWQPAR